MRHLDYKGEDWIVVRDWDQGMRSGTTELFNPVRCETIWPDSAMLANIPRTRKNILAGPSFLSFSARQLSFLSELRQKRLMVLENSKKARKCEKSVHVRKKTINLKAEMAAMMAKFKPI